MRELERTVSHAEGGRTSTVLGLDDFITTKLDTVDELLVLLALSNRASLLGLGEERNNGNARVATDDRDNGLCRSRASDTRQEGRSTSDVKGGDTEEPDGSAARKKHQNVHRSAGMRKQGKRGGRTSWGRRHRPS